MLQEQKLKEDKKMQQGKQPTISQCFKASPVLDLAVDMIIENAVSFELFDNLPMKTLCSLAKKGSGDIFSPAIYSENVKKALLERLYQKKDDLKRILEGKVVSLSADFATCWRRSFLGRLKIE